MIRDVFQHCTVFAIAHSATPCFCTVLDSPSSESLLTPALLFVTGLATIIDYDKVVVLEKGRLKQFGSPLELLDDKDGIFARLVEENGAAVSAHLHAMARGERRSPRTSGFGDEDTEHRRK